MIGAEDKSTVDQLGDAIGVVVSAVQGAIKMGGILVEFGDGTEISDHTPAEVIANVTATAKKVQKNVDDVYKATDDAVTALKNIDPKEVAESAKSAVAGLGEDLKGEAQAALAARGSGRSQKYQRSISGLTRWNIGSRSLSAMAPKTACVVG